MNKEMLDRMPKNHPARALRKPGVRLAMIVAIPFVALGLLIWGVLGALCTLPALLVAVVSTVGTWALYYAAFASSFVTAIDWPIVLTLGLIVLVAVPRKAKTSRIVAVGVWFVLLAFSIVRAVLLHKGNHAAIHALVACAVVLPPWLSVCHLKLWVAASLDALDKVEEKLYRQFIVSDFDMQIVAGLGTVIVPYCGDETNLPHRNLVLVHGYLAGNAFWAANLQALAKSFNVYAVEWKGIGRSDRPKLPTKSEHDMDAFFVDSMEEWREAMGLDRFILCGHSMGAIFCGYYTAEHAEHVEQLVLLSPAGVAPADNSKPLPAIYRFIMHLQLTPMSIVRFAGPFGMALSRWIMKKRVEWVPDTNVIRSGEMDFTAITTYMYHNFALPASGDVCVHTHLRLPGASAPHRPLCEVLTRDAPRVPLSIAYGGGNDWMPSAPGEALIRDLETSQYAVFRLIPGAGHQVFLDDPVMFDQTLLDIIRQCDRATKSAGEDRH